MENGARSRKVGTTLHWVETEGAKEAEADPRATGRISCR